MKKKLYIPVNIRRRKEIFSGFGKEEAIYTGIACCVGIMIGLFLYLLGKDLIFLILAPLVTGIFTGVFVIKDKCNTSVIQSILYILEFFRYQQKFEFQYFNIYEKEVKKVGKEASRKG